MPAPLAAIAGGLIKGALVGAKVGAKVAVKSSLKMGGSIARVGMRSGGTIVKRGGMVVKKSRVTMKKVRTNTAKSKKIDKDKFMKDKKRRAKEAEERRRKEREKLLEGSKDSNEKPNPEMKLKKPGGILGKIIDFLSTILIGWLVNTGLKLVNFIKKVIESIQNIGQSIKDFFTGIGDFFKKIGGAISNAFNTIKSFDISKIGDFIREKFDGIKNAFGNILKKIKGGLGLLKKKEQEDPKKIAKDGKLEEGKPQKPEEPTDVKGIKGTLDKVGSEISKGKETFDVAIDKAKKEIAKVGTEGTGVSTPTEQKIPTEKKEKVIDIKSGSAPKTPMKLKDEKDATTTSSSIKSDLSTITFDGMTFPKGQPGLGGYIPGGGKGGSTYEKTSSVMKSESIKSVTPDNQSVSNLTPNKKKQKIVVIDQDQSMASSTPSASTKILMLKNDSVNTMIEQQFLSNLAYT